MLLMTLAQLLELILEMLRQLRLVNPVSAYASYFHDLGRAERKELT